MAHAVMRGPPTAAQLYLEKVIEELVAETGRQEDRYCLNKILFKCLRDNPHEVRQIDGNTGDVETNKMVLQRAVRTARALNDSGLKVGDSVLIMSRSHVHTTGAYFGSLFAGLTMLLLHYEITYYELKNYIAYKKPSIIFTESSSVPIVEKVLQEYEWDDVKIVVFGEHHSGHQTYFDFISPCDYDFDGYFPADTHRDTGVVVMTTSGSTGLPKVPVLKNRGLVAHLPTMWTCDTQFRRPTATFLLTSSPNWISYTAATTCCAAAGVTILYTSARADIPHVRMLLRKYKPTRSIMPYFQNLGLVNDPGLEPDDFKCFELLAVGGGDLPKNHMSTLKTLMQPSARLGFSYGISEAHGIVTVAGPRTHLDSIGFVINVFEYQVGDESGNKLETNEPGELQLKSRECLFSEYLNNEEEYKKAFTANGWFKTGDRVSVNEKEELFFIDRLKFFMMYQGVRISLKEIELVIASVPGVHSAAACQSPRGPAALVVLLAGRQVLAQLIHDAVRENLTDAKRLRGGVVFVGALPQLPNGKMDMVGAQKLFDTLPEEQKHFDVNLL